MKPHVLLAIVLVAGLAGCAEREEAISARDGLGPALAAARAHGADPVLTGIASIEPFKHLAEEDGEIWVHLDDNPGDGLAPGWFYTFAWGDRTIGILYAAGLGVIAEGYEESVQNDEWGSAGEPITDWILDSTDVARLLRASAGWPAASDDTTVFWSLYQDEESGPVWFVEWDNATSGMEATIDARTGNITAGETYSFDNPWSCTQAWSSGSVVDPLRDASMQIEAAPGGSLDYEYSWSMLVGEATMRIEGPEGTLVTDTLAGSGVHHGSLGAVEGGTYTLTISTQLGVGDATIRISSCG